MVTHGHHGHMLEYEESEMAFLLLFCLSFSFVYMPARVQRDKTAQKNKTV